MTQDEIELLTLISDLVNSNDVSRRSIGAEVKRLTDSIKSSQAQALAEAREALNSVVKNIPSGEIEIAREVWGNTNTRIVLEAITKAADWLKKWSEK